MAIYILDDDEQYAQLLQKLVYPIHGAVTYQTSPSVFLKSKLEKEFVLILDLVMPEMDGIEVIREIAEKGLNASLILVSGFDERVLHSAQQLAEAYGMNVLGSMTKPIDIAKLNELLTNISLPSRPTRKLSGKEVLTREHLAEALEENYLVLHYQPQVSIKSRKLQGWEALVRIDHPEFGLVYPDRFISVAEEFDLITDLTKLVIERACKDITTNPEKFGENVLSINICSKDIISLQFPEFLSTTIEQYSVEPERLCLELTETAVMSELTSSLEVLNRLRMKGFLLSIDDFGTGYSSLTQLFNAPFTELKIDAHFVMRMQKDKDASVIVETCIMLGSQMGIKVVAEGVEDQETFDALGLMGCDIAQGYLFSKPLPVEELSNFLDNNQELLQISDND